MPDIFFDTLDAVPAELREHAKEDSGKVVVNVVPKVKLDEFRENNIKVSKERDDLTKVVQRVTGLLGEDFDVAENEIKELRTVHRRVKDGQLVENTSLEEALAERTKSMREAYEDQIRNEAKEKKAWQDKAVTTDLRLRRTFIDRAVTDAVLGEDSGAEPKALPDILRNAYDVFQVTEDGKLIAKNGGAVVYGEDGTTPMTPLEWLKKLRSDRPYFFKQSNGGGAGGGDKNRFGMSEADFAKLTPEQRLRIANGEKIRV